MDQVTDQILGLHAQSWQDSDLPVGLGLSRGTPLQSWHHSLPQTLNKQELGPQVHVLVTLGALSLTESVFVDADPDLQEETLKDGRTFSAMESAWIFVLPSPPFSYLNKCLDIFET